MGNSDVLKRSAILLVSLLFFAALTVPVYILMTAGAVRNGPEPVIRSTSSEEISLENAVPGMMGDNITDMAETSAQAERDALLRTVFVLNKGAFFGGFALIMILYVVYFLAILRRQFYPFLIGSGIRTLIPGLIPFLIFMVLQTMEINLVPLRLTKRLASIDGMPWELAYILLGFFLFFTLIGVWLDTNLNRAVMLDSVPFRYCRFGNGGRNLILIAGLNVSTLAGQGLNMAWLYRIFSKEYTVFVMDKKDEVPEGVTLEDLAEDIYRAMEEIGIVTADVVGVSQGGMIAQYLAIDHPEAVDKLVLGVTASRINDSITRYINSCITYAKKGEMEKILLDSFENDYTLEYTKKLRPFFPLLSRVGIPKSNTRFIRLAESVRSLDTYERLSEITCPVYVIGAGHDRVVSKQASEEIAEKLGCKKYIYTHYGHGVYTEAKDFNEKINRFLIKGK